MVLFSFVGSVLSLSLGIAEARTNTKAPPSLVGSMEEPPCIGLLSIRDDKPVWVCATVCCICKNEATPVYFPMRWVLLIEERHFSFSEEGL